MIIFEDLKEYIKGFENAAVAFSGGVDSTLLVHAAHEALGNRMTAVTIRSAVFPKREYDFVEGFINERGINHIYVPLDVFAIEGFKENPENRCYLCKSEMFGCMKKAAADKGFSNILEGSNVDDEGDYRPGMRAVSELGIISPFRDLRMTKADIRRISQEQGLETYNKPSFACLASRFSYGEEITKEKLIRIEQAENRLFSLGIKQLRVRTHGDIARIEVNPEDFPTITQHARWISLELRTLGFKFISLDLEGFKTGSMNRELTEA